MAKLLPEFPTEWHQRAFLDGLEREAEGYRRRIAELKAVNLKDDDQALIEATFGLENALRELARVGGRGQKNAAKRPVRAAEKR